MADDLIHEVEDHPRMVVDLTNERRDLVNELTRHPKMSAEHIQTFA